MNYRPTMKLTPEMIAIEKNVWEHIVQHVRQTYSGWEPLTTSIAWENALKRMAMLGRLEHRPELGGWVPRTWVKKLEQMNTTVLAQVRYTHARTHKPITVDKWNRKRLAAIKRLEQAGLVRQHGQAGYMPV